MTTLVVEPLKYGTPLEQEWRLSLNTRYNIGAFAPYLYLHGAPVGTFKFEIIVASVTIFEREFTSQDIKDALNTLNDYAHVFLPFVPADPIQMEKCIFITKLSANAAYDGQSPFIGWIKQHEDLNNELDYIPSSDLQNPLALRMKDMKEGIKI